MPNWNSNSITIEGPADKIRALWAAAQSNDSGLLEAMAPIGEWDYGRAVDAWGTKWDVSLEGLELIENEQGRAMITGWADSAWSPPIEAFQTYVNENSDVAAEIRFFEPGMSFIGVWDSENGEQIWEDVYKIAKNGTDDTVLTALMDEFNVWDWYDLFEDDEDTVEE